MAGDDEEGRFTIPYARQLEILNECGRLPSASSESHDDNVRNLLNSELNDETIASTLISSWVCYY